MRLIVAALAFGLFAAPAAALGPGGLDRSFGDRGRVLVALGPPDSESLVSDVAAVPMTGQLVVGGAAPGPAGTSVMTVARLGRAGRPDPAFGEDGVAQVLLGTGDSSVARVLALDNGGAVVAGQAQDANGAPVLALARLDASGTIVWAITRQLGAGPRPGSLSLDLGLRDAGVVVSGSASGESGLAEPLLARFLLADGSLDPAFGSGGFVRGGAPREDPRCADEPAAFAGLAAPLSRDIYVGGTCGGVSLLRAYSSATGVRAARDPATPEPLATIQTLTVSGFGTLYAGGTGEDGRPGAAVVDGPAGGAFDLGAAAGAVTDIAAIDDFRAAAAVDGPDGGRVVRLRSEGVGDNTFDTGGLAAAGLRSPRAVAVQRGGAVIVLAERAGRPAATSALARLYGGTTSGRVRLVRVSRVRGGVARVRLRCTGAPGCAGTIAGANVGELAYDLRPGASDAFDVPVVAQARGRRRLELRVSNPPAAPLQRTVTLR